MNIVFMGTPDFAQVSLDKLVSSGYNVSAVFTKPDMPVGRKRIMTPPEVKVAAEKYGITVYQPESMRDDQTYEILKGLAPDLIVVVAYGKILPARVLSLPKYGCINVHASLLPKYRGASPIQWSIVCGEKQTGVSTMLLDEGMDTGDVLLTASTEILDTDTAQILWDRLGVMGADLLIKTIKGIENGTITPTKQDDSLASYAPIIKKQDGLIDWSKTAREIDCKIRGLSAWPVAYTTLDGKMLKIFRAQVLEDYSETPAKILEKEKQFVVACKSGALKILELQLEGSKRMDVDSFLRGKKIEQEFLGE